jgi:hypothetical protein
MSFVQPPPTAFVPPPYYRQPRPPQPHAVRFPPPHAGRFKAVRNEPALANNADIVTVSAPVVPAHLVPPSASTPPPAPLPAPVPADSAASDSVPVAAPSSAPTSLLSTAAPPAAPHARQPRGPPREPQQADQRMRRVLARDHSFCYRCARTGHYTKDCMWFKTQVCKYWQEGSCRHGLKNGENVCMYAHGEAELRPVTQSWCIRVVHDNGNMLVFGCGAPFHTPELCPALQHQQQQQQQHQLPPQLPPPGLPQMPPQV